MRADGVKKVILSLELLVCFGPLFGVLVFGALLAWVQTLAIIPYLALSPESGPVGTEKYLLHVLALDFFVLSGLLGIAGLSRTVLLLVGRPASSASVRITLTMLAIGILALLAFNLISNPFAGFVAEEGLRVGGFLVYFLLPVLGGAHIIYLARKKLFSLGGSRAK